MRKLPQEFAFPLGLGTKRYQQQNGDGPLPNSVNNHITNLSDGQASNPDSATRRRSSQELDTINLWNEVQTIFYKSKSIDKQRE